MQFAGSMYAVIQTGGKQYRVQPGDIIQIEKLSGKVGDSVKLSEVLFFSQPGAESSEIVVGSPLVAGATVEGEIVGQGRGDKVMIVKMKRRKQYRRTQGHRQEQTQLMITSVDSGNGKSASLSKTEKTEALAKFSSHLAPKGPKMAPKGTTFKKKAAKKAAKQA